ncbi:MAG: flippase [Deltaproteobacteria bacterium]|nr:flippase [Deltaproteobacteria bacterium]
MTAPVGIAATADETTTPMGTKGRGGQKPKQTSFVRDVFGTYGTRALTIALGIVMGVITARTLGPNNRGIFSLVYLLPSTIVTFGKLGLAQASIYSIRRRGIEPHRVAANALLSSIFLGTFFVLITFLSRHYLLATVLRGVPEWAMLIALPLVPVLLFESYFYSILQAMGKFPLYNRRLLIGTCLLVAGMAICLIGFHGGLLAAILVVVCVPIGMDTWLLITVRRWFPFSFRFDLPLLKEELRFGFKSHIQVLAQHLHLRADAYIVAYFLDPTQVAFYTLAVRLAEFMLDVPESIGMVLYPKLAALNDEAMHELTAQACRRTVLVTAIGAAILSLFGPWVIVLWYGEAYAPAGRPLPFVAAGIVMMSLFVLLTRNFTSRNRQQVNVLAGFVALVGNVGLNLFTIPHWGIVGAAMASTISYSLAACLLLYFFSVESKRPWTSLLIPQRSDLRYFVQLTRGAIARAKRLAAQRGK